MLAENSGVLIRLRKVIEKLPEKNASPLYVLDAFDFSSSKAFTLSTWHVGSRWKQLDCLFHMRLVHQSTLYRTETPFGAHFQITHFPPHQGARDQLRLHLSGGLQVIASIGFSSWVGCLSAIQKGPCEPAQPQKEIGEAQVDKRPHLWKDESNSHSID